MQRAASHSHAAFEGRVVNRGPIPFGQPAIEGWRVDSRSSVHVQWRQPPFRPPQHLISNRASPPRAERKLHGLINVQLQPNLVRMQLKQLAAYPHLQRHRPQPAIKLRDRTRDLAPVEAGECHATYPNAPQHLILGDDTIQGER